MIRIPQPPGNLDPIVRQYLQDLVDSVQLALAEHDSVMQKKGEPVVIPTASVADLTTVPARFRPGQANRLVFCPTAQANGGALCVSHDSGDGNGDQWKSVRVGPVVS